MQLPDMKPGASYNARVLAMTRAVLTLWRTAGGAQLYSLTLSFTVFVVDLIGAIIVLLAPFTFMLSPLYVWLYERRLKRRLAREAEFKMWMQRADEIAKGKQ